MAVTCPGVLTRLRPAIDAALVMAVGMGFGRFAFTAIYPHMVDEGLLSLHEGGLAASINYAGYLLGALLAMRARAHDAYRLCVWSTVGTIACLAALAVTGNLLLVVAIRGVAGVFSALSMVAASLWLLVQRQQIRQAPLLYAGVGLGIAVSAELLVLGAQLGLRSPGLWLLLGVISLVIGILALSGMMASGRVADQYAPPKTIALSPVRPTALIVVYGLSGFGYIITATYLPLLVKMVLPNIDAAHVWAVFGAGAVPSCFLWHWLHLRLGTRRAMCANLGLQALGVALPVLMPSAAGYLLSALLVGGTFMGTVTIAMPAAQRAALQGLPYLMAAMTLVYGVGQIIGPLAANVLLGGGEAFNGALMAAALALMLAALMSRCTL